MAQESATGRHAPASVPSPVMPLKLNNTGIALITMFKVPTEIQKHNSMIFPDQQCNFNDVLMQGLQPPFLATSSPC